MVEANLEERIPEAVAAALPKGEAVVDSAVALKEGEEGHQVSRWTFLGHREVEEGEDQMAVVGVEREAALKAVAAVGDWVAAGLAVEEVRRQWEAVVEEDLLGVVGAVVCWMAEAGAVVLWSAAAVVVAA